MTGEKIAVIFNTCPAFECGCKQISELPNDARDEAYCNKSNERNVKSPEFLSKIDNNAAESTADNAAYCALNSFIRADIGTEFVLAKQ